MIDKIAIVANDVILGDGTYVAKGAVIEPASVIEEIVIINISFFDSATKNNK